MAHARAGGPLSRRRPEHDPQMVGSGPRPGLLHAWRSPTVPPLGPRVVSRPLGPAGPAEERPARTPRRRRREGARARPRQPRVRGLHRPRGRERRGGDGGDRGGEAGSRPARRDDAARRRLGDAAPRARALRRRRDPGRHVQRQGRRRGGAPGERGRRAGVHRQAVRSAAADRPDEVDRSRLTSWDRHAERWIVHHRWRPLNHVFVWLTKIGTHGLVWLVLAVIVAVLLRSVWVFVVIAAAVLAADGIAGIVKLAVGESRPNEPDPLIVIPHSHSFPSGHTATSFAGATALSLVYPRGTPAFLLLAAAIAY